MGDHGQTLNGDHGGGSAEEVCTSLIVSFRMLFIFSFVNFSQYDIGYW